MTSFQTLLTDVSGRVATIWLNRPERRNAFPPVMTRELHEAFALYESDDHVRAIVVTGADRYFSAAPASTAAARPSTALRTPSRPPPKPGTGSSSPGGESCRKLLDLAAAPADRCLRGHGTAAERPRPA
jgi:hypothetical protein